jgi:hypothetical protein
MAKMHMAQKERPHVKLKCVTMLLGLKLEPQKEWIISEFIDTYLKLSEEEEREYESELKALGAEKREEVMQVRMSWREQGEAKGRAEGESKAALAIAKRILNRRLGPLDSATLTVLEGLAVAKLEELSEAAIDFGAATDLSTWLAANQ